MKAPSKVNVLSFLFNRPDHTKETISALLEQKEFINKIFFYIDRPTNEKDIALQSEVFSVLMSLITKHKLSKYEIIIRSENYGIAKSITTATNEYCKSHIEPFVVIEDDCKPGEGFMTFMAYSFSEYKDDPDVYTVCGYQYHEDDSEVAEIELSLRFNPWGWGSWPEKWNFKWFNGDFTEDIRDLLPPSVRSFTEDKRYLNGKMDIWSTTVVIQQFANKKLTVVPTRSLIENIGMDGSGVHSDATDAFNISTQKITTLSLNFPKENHINYNRENIIEDSLSDKLGMVMNKK